MTNNNQSLLEMLLHDSSFKNWANKSNQNDIAFWDAWIAKNPDKIELVYSAKAIIKGIAFNKSEISEEKVSLELNKVLEQIVPQKPSVKSKYPFSRIKKYTAIAAMGLVLIAFAYNAINGSSEAVHKTGFGEIIDLTLPDGTSVVLNGNSELSYDKDNSRDVVLVGEAYFKVSSKPSTKAKFWVNTKDLRIEVFGTQFHVNTHEEKTDVVLDEGSINLLLKNGDTKKMEPGELASFSSEKNVVIYEKVTKELPYSLWREGTYIFNNISLLEVMKNIEDSYGLPTEFIDEELKHKKLTGGIPNQNIKICLSAIEKSTGTRIVLKDNKLLIFNN